jgi:hypothetical protein
MECPPFNIDTGTKSRAVDMNKTPKENHVTAFRPALLPRKYATGDNRRGIKVAAKRKYDSAILLILTPSYS